MNDFVIYLLSTIGISTIAIWLGKLIITKSFDLGIEKYKATLIKENEEFKSQLSKISLEHQVRFTKLHDQRAEKIQVLYSKVIELEKALIFATSEAQGPEYFSDTARDEACIEKLRDLIRQLDYDKIYFSVDTIKKFENIIKESWKIISQMRKVRRYASAINDFAIRSRPAPEMYYSETDLWQNANERTEKEFKILKDELANEFRVLLGI